MSELTASDTQAILGAIQAMRNDMQALTLEVRVNQAKNDEQFKALNDKVEAVRAELKSEIKAVNDKVDGLRSELRDDVNELHIQQGSTDARLWTFIVGLVTLVGGGVIKVLWFDHP
ncbi:hypothetical protein [Synechococcus sp. PCC 6312]|uniref:hypothetical protein n=1 Tax=Synechococcus sp. (strain ATCC 27167 / PCC 6312) TaxID=195253 RepID=UPI00029F3EE8|nr:hypothetical protein [Synechococcus sp. PCC 6312]AFY59547.1 hypothetical protein Syn6312_0310 [Synechococcus sp. PCC 6312]